MASAWGGAQWVLATLMVAATLAPLALRSTLRSAGVGTKSSLDFAGWYIQNILERMFFVVILWWGGFWS